MGGLGLMFRRRAIQAHPTAGSDYIKFADDEVFNILMANGVSSDGVGITKEDVAKVTDIKLWFRQSSIRTFDELEYFTGLTFLSSSTDAVKEGAFEYCDNLESVVLPYNVTTIGDYTFRDCKKLTSVGNTSRIERIRRGAFNNTLVPELILPSCTSLAGIGEYSAFKKIVAPLLTSLNGVTLRMQKLEYFEVGNKLTTIDAYTFWQMATGLTTFILPTINPPTLGASNNMNFCSAVYVPDESVEAYKAAANWSSYASKIKPLSEYQG